MIARIISAVVALPIVLWLNHRGGWPFLILVVLASGVVVSEIVAMARPLDGVVRGAAIVLGTLAALSVATGTLGSPTGLALSALGLVGFLLTVLFRERAIDRAGTVMGLCVLGILWGGGLLAIVAALRLLPEGDAWVLQACIMAWGSDTGGYFAGRAFGKTKLMERVSPKKTWAGSVGGVIAASFLALGLWALVGPRSASWLEILAIAPVVAAAGQMGDLAESLLKRSAGVKDSGRIMPGHGGLFDRVDALLFTAPCLFAYATWVLGLVPGWLRIQ